MFIHSFVYICKRRILLSVCLTAALGMGDSSWWGGGKKGGRKEEGEGGKRKARGESETVVGWRGCGEKAGHSDKSFFPIIVKFL